MILDPLKPYLQIIRITGYVVLVAFLFVSGCQYGKHKQTVAIAKLETDLGVCRDANSANLETIKTLQGINAEYALQGAKEAEKVGKVQNDLKTAQKRADALEKALTKGLRDAKQKNPDWADTAIPDDYKRLLNSSGKD